MRVPGVMYCSAGGVFFFVFYSFSIIPSLVNSLLFPSTPFSTFHVLFRVYLVRIFSLVAVSRVCYPF